MDSGDATVLAKPARFELMGDFPEARIMQNIIEYNKILRFRKVCRALNLEGGEAPYRLFRTGINLTCHIRTTHARDIC